MAGYTIPLKVIKRFYGSVAGFALIGCTCIFTIDVTLFALQDRMLSGQREKCVLCASTPWRKQDCHRDDTGCIGVIRSPIRGAGFLCCRLQREECRSRYFLIRSYLNTLQQDCQRLDFGLHQGIKFRILRWRNLQQRKNSLSVLNQIGQFYRDLWCISAGHQPDCVDRAVKSQV